MIQKGTITAVEAKEKFLEFVRQLVSSDSGFTLSDILNNDFNSVIDVVQKGEAVESEKVVDLGDFMKTL
ncbi:hypothetical protein AAFF39_03685 [Lactococcus garvieae]